METTTLNVAATLDAPPADVFEILTTSDRHSAFTGGSSTIDARRDGAFSYFDGAITGTFVEVDGPGRMVQRLHAASWPDGHHATVTTELDALGEGARTRVKVVEVGVPADELDAVIDGWSGYWTRLSHFVDEERKDVVRRFVEEYKNRQNPDIVDELVAEDCRVHIPLPGLPRGREGMRVNGRTMCGAFPDVRVEREFFVADGDIVVERALARATHLGELMGEPPTERPVTWTELHAYRVEGGRITEVWSEADFMGVMVQIGAVDL